MNVYISGPMTGVDDYFERFSNAEKRISRAYPHMKIINPAIVASVLPDNLSHEDYLSIDLVLLKNCDYIYMMPGWMESKGANIEYNYAKALDIKELVLESDDEYLYNLRCECNKCAAKKNPWYVLNHKGEKKIICEYCPYYSGQGGEDCD